MPGTVRRFEWDDAVPGLCSDEFVTVVSAESIRAYVDATGDHPPDGPVMAGQLSPDPAQRIGHFLGDFPFDPKPLEFSGHQTHPDIQEGERLRICL